MLPGGSGPVSDDAVLSDGMRSRLIGMRLDDMNATEIHLPKMSFLGNCGLSVT
jgi:hypothetical protein